MRRRGLRLRPEVRTRHRGARGFTLVETLIVLGLLSIVLGAALPAAAGTRDRLAVRGAREAAAGLLARARFESVLRGGAEVLVTEAPGRLVLRAGGRSLRSVAVGDRYGAGLEIAGSVSRAVLRFDALGIGRMTSRTIRFRRGDAVASLAVSAYGRIRRR